MLFENFRLQPVIPVHCLEKLKFYFYMAKGQLRIVHREIR